MIVTILAVICGIVLTLYLFSISSFDYWKKRGVNGPKPLPFVGNFPSAFTQKRHLTYDVQDIYEKFKNTDNFVGIYNCRTPQLLITNAALLRRILVTDFKSFHDNDASTMVDKKSDLLFGNNPFILTGEEWKERRAEVTPGFTTNRIKTVFPVTKKVCKSMVDYIVQLTKMGAKGGIDGKDLSLRYTCEVVSDCILGLRAECFTSKPTPIMAMTNKLFDQSFILVIYSLIVGMLPWVKKVKKLRFTPKPVETFFLGLLKEALHLRKTQKEQGVNEDRVDFINFMLQLQDKKNLSLEECTSHTMTFLLDGFETTATVLSHCLLLLGRDMKRQTKLRNEILEKLDENTDFDALTDLPYLDACIHETIRLFSPATFTSKLCTEPITLENKNGKTLNIKAGTTIILPVQAVMLDGDHFEEPQKFQPERFLDGGLKKFRNEGKFLGFGDGPRVCLGMRFALTQIKGALVEIMRNFEIHINPKTRTDNRFDPTYFMSRLDGGIWLEFKKI